MAKEFTIMEDGNIWDITKQERDLLLDMDAIYHCPDCGEIYYHLGDVMDVEGVNAFLNQLK